MEVNAMSTSQNRFNFIYNNDETIGLGKGYYIIFEGYDKKIKWDSYYPTWEHNEQVDGVSVGILNKIQYLIDMGYKLDIYMKVNLKELF